MSRKKKEGENPFSFLWGMVFFARGEKEAEADLEPKGTPEERRRNPISNGGD